MVFPDVRQAFLTIIIFNDILGRHLKTIRLTIKLSSINTTKEHFIIIVDNYYEKKNIEQLTLKTKIKINLKQMNYEETQEL